MTRWPDDVPVDRGSVGAMTVTTGSLLPSIDRPYVYRGTGVDQYEPYPGASTPKRKNKPKKKKAKARKPYTPPRRRYYRPPPKTPTVAYRDFTHGLRLKRIPPTTHKSWLDWDVRVRRLSEIRPKPKPVEVKPLTGEDIDALLDML